MALEFIWIRIGDGGEYERHDSLDEAVAEIHATVCNDHRDRDASELPCPDGHAVTDMRQSKALNGIGVDSYVAYNGISLYHGDADAEITRPISDDEYNEARKLLGMPRWCWYCEGDANDSHGIDLSNPYPSNVTIGQTYRISIYPTSAQVLAIAKPDRWLIVDREWLDTNEDAFGDDVCYHITDDVLTVDRQSLHTSASEVN